MTAARAYSWPPFEPGHELSMTHGAYSERKFLPLAERFTSWLADVAPWTSAPAMSGSVRAWAIAEARAELLRSDVNENGDIDDDGDERPASKMLHKIEITAANRRAELGLNPLALAKLLGALSSIDSPAVVGGLEALKAAGRDAVAQAEQRALEAAQESDSGE